MEIFMQRIGHTVRIRHIDHIVVIVLIDQAVTVVMDRIHRDIVPTLPGPILPVQENPLVQEVLQPPETNIM